MTSPSFRRPLIAFLSAAILCGSTYLVVAAEPVSGTQRITVRNLPVDAAAIQLQSALDVRKSGVEVFVDSKARTLILSGTAEGCRLGVKLLGDIDRPVAQNSRIVLAAQQVEVAAEKQPALGEKEQALSHLSGAELVRTLSDLFPGLKFEAEADSDRVSARLPGEQRTVMTINRRQHTVRFEGDATTIASWRRMLAAIDAPRRDDEAGPAVIALDKADPAKVQQAIKLLKAAQQAVLTKQPGDAREMRFIAQNQNQNPPADAPKADENASDDADEGPIGPVTIEILEGLDVIVVRGKKRDVERVQKIIEDIERQSQITIPEIEVFTLKHIDGKAAADLIAQIYDQVFGPRQARVSITPLYKPNALLLIGRKESVAAVKDLVTKLDQPVPPQSQFRAFPLKFISAVDAEKTVRNFFVLRPGFGTDERPNLGARVNVIADYRSNLLLVQASGRDLQEVAELIKKIDVNVSQATNQMRIIRLKNALAEELAPVIQEAISGQRTGGGAGGATAPATGTSTSTSATRGNANLQLLQIDQNGRRLLESGILSEMRVTADPRGNALLVSGPEKGMDLLEALIIQLDQLPVPEAQIKVFTLVNGDSQTLITALQQLFGQQTGGGQGTGQLPQTTATGGGDSTLVPLRFTADQRTNSVIATGSAGDLEVVERVLIRLDEGDVRRRKTTVYRLRNAPATDVSTAINQFLQNQRQVNQLAPTLVSQVEQIEREVVVVPERVSNSLLVSATPRYYEEIQKIVEDLDKRPPMVVIQVLIAEVRLDNLDEFGVELGLQDSLLFDRGIGTVGFPFNGSPLGNNSTAQALATRNAVGTQGTSNFATARTNTGLGYGGLVLSASSDSVNILVRALQRSRRLQVISRPQVQTLDNQPAFVQVGARVPRISSSNQINNTIQNVTTLENVGILLGVTPRTSPDGLIVMEINAEKSELSPEAEGIPIFVAQDGTVVRSPQIFITTAQTTVSARSGQTVILGGLITKSRDQESRRVPYLSDIPVLGRLFRYDANIEQKKELLIIMTPYVMRTDEDVDWLNARETERMNWCLSDVADVHGELPWAKGIGPWNQKKTPIIFPDVDPTGLEGTTPSSESTSPSDVVPPSNVIPPSSAVPPSTLQPPVDNNPFENPTPMGKQTRNEPPLEPLPVIVPSEEETSALLAPQPRMGSRRTASLEPIGELNAPLNRR